MTEPATKTMNMIEAINSALDLMLAKDPEVVIMAEDVGYFGGVFRATAGLQKKHGKTRVFDTPISECGITIISQSSVAICESCASIWFSIAAVPLVTIVIRERCASCSVSETVRLSIL